MRRELGMAMGIYKGGVGQHSGAEVKLLPSGRITAHIRVVVVGQRWATVLAQIAAEVLQVPSSELVNRAHTTVFADAQPLSHNAFKIDIGRALVARAIMAVSTLSFSLCLLFHVTGDLLMRGKPNAGA